ncbi:glycosyltransferase [Aeromicrobium chenweiae]|uniref:Glycosyl transferase family 1 n=1 Tax=Aeromicrobium chenweiae TaxID=2079793 RepID=A0A2S0WLS4_9ACTN|nr:glycosyltransferase [Aeromicrobium chenweiae]AWB92276.1 glycosyl transferase family 1 [Aeromicrobium chenweiae]TGN31440.1 glycosyltransferase [Aeromicrobium chenweiae]
MREVHIDPMSVERLAHLMDPERAERLEASAALARRILDGRVVWNVSSTASGGGVAEMLTTLLSYTRGAGIDTRWLVLEGSPGYFRLTKRLHNVLHGVPGDGGPLGDAERDEYESVLADNFETLRSLVRAGDIVLLHDPQTAGLAAGLRAVGAHVVWRCHIGRDNPTELTDLGWSFLEPYVSVAQATVFSREAYGPRWLDRRRSRIIPPSLDPFSTKNVDLPPGDVDAVLRQAALVTGPADHGNLAFDRRDGTAGTVRAHRSLFAAGDEVPADVRVVLQVSRWDRLKDMAGVLTAFAAGLRELPSDTHLMLVGPEASGVGDDPEGAEVLAECVDLWKTLPVDARERVHLVALPMDDVGENAHLVNALQRHASVVVQKSLVEGFGLTVTEAMWKNRPVVASAVGGIQDQITDGADGLLLADPADLAGFTDLIARVLDDDHLAQRLGDAAGGTVRDRYLGDRNLIQYVDLFSELLQE